MSPIPRRQRRRLAAAAALGVGLLAAAAFLQWVYEPPAGTTGRPPQDGGNETGPAPCPAPCLEASQVRIGASQAAAWTAGSDGLVVHDVAGQGGRLAAAVTWDAGQGVLWWDDPLGKPRLLFTLEERPVDLAIAGDAVVWSTPSGIGMWRPGMEEPLPRAPGHLRLLAVEGRTALVHCRSGPEEPEPQAAFCTVDIEEGGIRTIEATRTLVRPDAGQEVPWPAGGLHAGIAWTVWADGSQAWHVARAPLDAPDERVEVLEAAAPIGRLAADEDQVVWHVTPTDGPAQAFVHHPWDGTMHPVEAPAGTSSRDPTAAEHWVVVTTRTPAGTEELWTLDGLGRLDTMLLRAGDTHPVDGKAWSIAATAGAGDHVLVVLADPRTGEAGPLVIVALPAPPEEQLS